MSQQKQNHNPENKAWHGTVLTLYPELYPGPLGISVLGRAMQEDIWKLQVLNMRDYSTRADGRVDDIPYGGGPGMIIKAEVIDSTLTALNPKQNSVVNLSPRGKPFTHETAKKLAASSGVTIVCGRYEGIDQRVIDKWQMQEISIGDVVLCGGDIAAMAILEATVRLLPKVLGNDASSSEDSFEDGLLEFPQYTRPQQWQGYEVPKVLASGNHEHVRNWRKNEQERITKKIRPDLWQKKIQQSN